MEEPKVDDIAAELEKARQRKIGKWFLWGMIAFTVIMASCCAFTQPIAVTLAILMPGVVAVIICTRKQR